MNIIYQFYDEEHVMSIVNAMLGCNGSSVTG